MSMYKRLVTGLTNFCGETLRKELLANRYYLSIEEKIYQIQNDASEFRLIDLLLNNVIKNSPDELMDVFKIDNNLMNSFKEQAANLLKSVFEAKNTRQEIKSEYGAKNIKYNIKNKRFEMEINGQNYDATGWIYTKIEQILID